ncbi:hypothetical protein P171DRAFT_169510 [Karstenula rhodostoma CBS 690.94]|uniref:Uncharacterized protein n=1 Tax=Karstenula rhodostoma CBS 690.94 TaxID=1392251 RepID=A0A9P4P6L9_9PLEO|nr:hypothetical protein P171DRAFT_169510 [Karstenula rhodostoma CBS 690.94]
MGRRGWLDLDWAGQGRAATGRRRTHWPPSFAIRWNASAVSRPCRRGVSGQQPQSAHNKDDRGLRALLLSSGPPRASCLAVLVLVLVRVGAARKGYHGAVQYAAINTGRS